MSKNREMPDMGWQFKSKEHGGWLDTRYDNLLNLLHNHYEIRQIAAPAEDVRAVVEEPVEFQMRVRKWMIECFGVVIAADRQERNHRFLEEALELVQACNCGWDEAHQLVDYVYGRPVGEKSQEVGGVMVTLAALCLAQNLEMHTAAEVELARVWTKVEQIRAKQLAKPAIGPLPSAYPDRHPQRPVVLPERKTQRNAVPYGTYDYGWNACLDAVEELNK